jgi:hypothetical protein
MLSSDNVQLVAAVATVAAVTAAATAASWRRLSSTYKRTRGSRRELQKVIWRLSPGAALCDVEGSLGQPTYHRSLELCVGTDKLAGCFESVYFTRHAIIQIIHTALGEVLGVSVTVTDPKFHPTFQHLPQVVDEQHPVILGMTTFSAVPIDYAEAPFLFRGAQLAKYSELAYFGRPGRYFTYHLSNNPTGIGHFDQDHCRVGIWPGDDLTDEVREEWRLFRKGTTIDTVGIFSGRITVGDLRDSPLRFGVDPDATPGHLKPGLRQGRRGRRPASKKRVKRSP